MKITNTSCLVIAILLSSINLFSQANKGIISGKVTNSSSSNNEEIIGAVVQIEGTGIGTVTDFEGKYNLSAAPGSYNLLFNYTGFKSVKLPVVVQAGNIVYADNAMEEEKTALNEVVIVQKVQKSSSVSMLLMRKNATVVSDGVSAEMIRKTPDRNVSDVLKRVTGASIQEGKFAVIRGMNDRYNAGYLDNVLLPSTEADRKAFSFDIVPANLIDNLQILKTGSADMVGDFGGGIIKINTKSLKTVSSFPTTAEKERLVAGSKLFTHDWENKTISAPLNLRFSYGLGFPIKISDSKKLGLILALNYSDTRRTNSGEVSSFDGSG